MQVLKDTLWLFPAERITVLEIYRDDRMVFYSYSYQIADDSGKWHDRIVWHNFEQKDHYDVFDEGGKLIVHQELPRITIKEVLRLVRIFRKNLMNIDLTTL